MLQVSLLAGSMRSSSKLVGVGMQQQAYAASSGAK
jgi:hypothetical protein